MRTEDGGEALAGAGDFRRSAPVINNLVLSLLQERLSRPEPGRYWTAVDDGKMLGLILQSPLSFHGALTPRASHAVTARVEAVAAEVPDLPGVFGQVDATARFAGDRGQVRKVPVTPVEGQRQRRLTTLPSPVGIPGRLRVAGEQDEASLWSWLQGFQKDTGGLLPGRQTIGITEGLVVVWEEERAVAMASCTPPLAGVSRIGLVYTPPAHRRRLHGGHQPAGAGDGGHTVHLVHPAG